MKAYLVGGAVRDLLRGVEPEDRDYVVVGSTPEEMLTAGFLQVGASFPVFLHPTTHEEYALARRERGTDKGAGGFAFDFAPGVTLEEDLRRRDFTCNAIAHGPEGYVDPLDGRADIAAGRLRVVSEKAFVEDPLRILRMARFAAQLGFCPDEDALELARRHADALNEVPAERVWQETARALRSSRPSQYFVTLERSAALAIVFPEVAGLLGVEQSAEHHPEGDAFEHTMLALDAASGAPLRVLVAVLFHDTGKGRTPRERWPKHHGHEDASAAIAQEVLLRLRAPDDVRRFTVAAARNHMKAQRWATLRPGSMLEILEEMGLFRDPAAVGDFLAVIDADRRGRGKAADDASLRERRDFFVRCAAAAQAVRARDLVARGIAPGPSLGSVLTQERILAIKGLAVR